MITRKCNKCKTTKSLDDFPKDKKCTLGHTSTCKVCRNDYGRAWKEHSPTYKIKRKECQERYKKIAREKALINKKKMRKEQPFLVRCRVMRSGMVSRSKKQNLPFDNEILTVEYLQTRITNNPKCECCGKSFNHLIKDGKPNDDSPTIDKIIPSLGYVESNIAILCWRCNNLKRDANSSELSQVANWLKSKETD